MTLTRILPEDLKLSKKSNEDAPTTIISLEVSGSVAGSGNAGPQILFTIPVSGESKIGAAIRANKNQSDENNSTTELNFSTSGNDENLDRILKIDNTGAAVHGIGASEVFPSSGYAFMVAASGDSSAVSVVNSNGNVGIGVQNAQNPLHVKKSNTSIEPFVEIENASSGDAALMFSISGDCYAMGIDNNDSDRFKISYATSAGGARLGTNDRLIIKSSGEVGIGSSAPGRLLDVAGSDAGNYILEANNTSSTGRGFLVKAGTASTSHLIVGQAGGVTEFIVYSDGDVKNTNGSYTALSDARIKENIEDAGDHYLDDLMQVKVRKYSLKKNNSPGPTHIGVIAQELETVFPGLVSEHDKQDENGDPTGETEMSVKMSVFVPILIRALQTLTRRVEELENRGT
tara:strand:- start:311 stop:1513 length:1203 start_codon:yes stop_codon:yes gene_type:complete